MTGDETPAPLAHDRPTASGAAARGRFLTDPDAIAALAAGWSRLAAGPGVNPVFLSPQWFRVWRDSFGEGLTAGVLAIESGAETIGVMPTMIAAVRRGPSLSPRLAYRRGDEAFATNLGRYRVVPLRQLSPALGLECGNLRGGFAHAAGRRDEVRPAIARALADLPGWDVAVLPTAADDVDAWTADARTAGLRVAARPVRAYYATSQVLPWAEFLRTRSRHFRKRINPSVKRAAQLGLSFATRSGTAVDGPALAAFFALGARSWKQQGRAGEAMTLPVTDATRRFFTAIAAAPGDILPVLHEIRSGDEVRAAMLGLARDGVLVLCLTYFDPGIAEVWPGRLLFRECFDWAAVNAIRQVDFNANHPGWARFADTTRVYSDLLLFRPGLVGAALARLAARFAPPSFVLETDHEA